jgi:hypothetical protein
MSNVIPFDTSRRVSKSFLAIISYQLVDGRETTTAVSLEATSSCCAIKSLMDMGVLDGRKGLIDSVSFYMTNVSDYVRLGKLPKPALTLNSQDLALFYQHHSNTAKVFNF